MSKSLTRDDKKKQTSERISDIYEFTSDDNEGYEIMPKKRRRMRQQTKKKKRKKECWPIILQPIEKERRKGRFTLKAKVRVGPNVQMNGIKKSGQSIVSSANGFASNISKRTFQNINKINEMATMQSDSLDSGADQSVGYSKPINGWIFNSKNVHSAKGDCLTKKRRQPMKLYSQDVIYCEYLESGDKETKASDQHCAQRTHLNVQSDVIAKQLSKLNGIVSECSENVCNIADVMMKNQCNRSNVSYSYRRQTSTKTNFTDDNLRSAFNWAHHDENNNNIASDEIFSLNVSFCFDKCELFSMTPTI